MLNWLIYARICVYGGVTEWLKVAVLKTAVPKGTGGSNPSPSAIFDFGTSVYLS